MKHISIAAILAMLSCGFVGCSSTPAKSSAATEAASPNEDLIVDGKLIRITDISSSDHVLYNKDLTGGIYILTSAGVTGAQDNLPYAEAIIRESLTAHGVKVANKPEDANIAISFLMLGSANMADANNKASHSNLPGTGKVLSSAGAIAAGVASGGVFAAVGYLAGALIPTDEKTHFSGFIIDKPVMQERGLFTKRMVVVATEDKMSSYSSTAVAIKYQLEKDKEAPEDAILKMMIDKWIKRCIVFDTKPVAASPASAISVAEAAPEAKK